MHARPFFAATFCTAVILGGAPAHAESGLAARLGGGFQGLLAEDGGALSQGAYEAGARRRVALGSWLGIGFQAGLNDDAGVPATPSVFLDGQWGELRFGAGPPPVEAFTIGAPSVLPHNSVFYNDPTPIEVTVTTTGAAAERERVVYYSPSLGGLKFGLAFTPDDCGEGGCTELRETASAEDTRADTLEMALAYDAEFSQVGVSLFAGLAKSRLEQRDQDPRLLDGQQWDVGAELSYSGFSIGAGYGRDSRGIDLAPERRDWNLGLAYETGPWGVSLGFARTYLMDEEGLPEDRIDQAEFAFAYDVGRGVVLGGALQWWDFDRYGEAEGVAEGDDSISLMFGSKLKF